MRRRFKIQTFGCQMNVNDSEKVAGLLLREGHEPAANVEDADFVFVNTCAVREKASQKLYNTLLKLGRMRAENPRLTIGVGGCVAQLEGTGILERAPGVDLLVGTHNLARVPELLRDVSGGSGAQVDLDRSADSFAIPPASVAHTSRVRAYVTAMEGCNHVCSFCVVPRTRGPEVCRAPDAIVKEAESLVSKGFAEIMLLGQTVNAYRHGETSFVELLARVAEVPGGFRLRFTTSHPVHVDEALADAFRDVSKLCPYLHLPFQSGSDRILREMRRGHTRAEYLERIDLLRSRVPELALSSDVIVGYPGETEQDFLESLEVLDQVGFDSLFSFMYSPRPGTTAGRQPDDVPDEEKRRRLRELSERQQRAQKERNERRVGLCEEVLVDTLDGPGRLSGRTPHFRIVHFDGPEGLLGRAAVVEVTGAGPNSLTGRLNQQAAH